MDNLAENPTNSIWLGSNPEHFNENIERINLQNFKHISLDLVLRNTRLINNLANDIRRYTLRYSKAAKKALGEYTRKSPSMNQRNYDDERHLIPKSGHVVEGLPPRLVILE